MSSPDRITSTCPHCQATFVVPATVAGKRTKCTTCGERFELTAVEPWPEPEASPAQPRSFLESMASAPADSRAPLVSEAPIFVEAPSVPAPGTLPPPPPPPARAPANGVATGDTPGRRHGALRSSKWTFLPLQIICWVIDFFAAWVAVGILIAVYDVVSRYQKLQFPSGEDLLSAILASLQIVVGGGLAVSLLLIFTQLARLMLRIERNTFEQVSAQDALRGELRAMLEFVQRS